MNPVSSIIVSVILSSAILHWSCAVEYDDYIKDKKKIIKHLKEENEGPICKLLATLNYRGLVLIYGLMIDNLQGRLYGV